ncbi:MAG: DUF6443 domain-containing protein, partial [Bacteroidota bacterium]|nr:DUF6443 domain-containing protein [Bacteroidota bacterium]
MDTTPGVITTDGTTSQLSATSATICLGSTLKLVPPANSANWAWSGANVDTNSSTGVATVQPVAENNTYSLTYTPAGTSCPITISFVVNAVSGAGHVEVLDNDPASPKWHYGTGVFTFVVKNPDPLRVYSWYASDKTTLLATGTSWTWTTYVTQSGSYYVSSSLCQESTAIPVLIRHVQLQVQTNGVLTVPTGPVRLVPGTPLTLQASSQSPGTLTWFFNGLQMTNQTGSSLVVTQVGRYTVRVQYPGGSGLQDESQPVNIIGGLDNQSANDQALTYVSDTQVLKAGVTLADQVAQLATADRTQTITYLTGWGQPLQQVAVQASPSQQDLVQHVAYSGDPATSRTYLPLPSSNQGKVPGLYETDPVGKLNAYYNSNFAESQPYATATAEASPLGRPVSQAPAGSIWASHPN